MTNAHAIVPGMLPSTVGRGLNTAWQVGLAAGLAATANLRPPNPALSHQAATTAAAARAAAAFQASRAFSMAKSQSQQSPLLQQGSIGTSVSGGLILLSCCSLWNCIQGHFPSVHPAKCLDHGNITSESNGRWLLHCLAVVQCDLLQAQSQRCHTCMHKAAGISGPAISENLS